MRSSEISFTRTGNLPPPLGNLQHEGYEGTQRPRQRLSTSRAISGDQHYAMDNHHHSFHSLDRGLSQQLHPRRMDPYSSGPRPHCSDLQPAVRQTSPLITLVRSLAAQPQPSPNQPKQHGVSNVTE